MVCEPGNTGQETAMTRRTSGQTPEERAKSQAKYNSKPEQVKRRGQRNTARAKMIKAGKVRRGDGKDVAHQDNNTSHNSFVNLLVQPPSRNRSFKRDKKGGHRNG